MIRPPRTTGRLIAWTLSLAVLLLTGTMGTYNGLTEWEEAATPLQHAVTASVLGYGVLGVVAFLALLHRRRIAIRWCAAWAVAVTFVGSAAVPAYGGPDATAGAAIVGGLATLLIASLVVWTARAVTHLHGASATPSGASQ
jgi:hypothetical protein